MQLFNFYVQLFTAIFIKYCTKCKSVSKKRKILQNYFSLEQKTEINLVSSTLKKPSKNYTCFISTLFGLFLIHLQSKIKQHLAMSAIQNHKALWRRKRQCCDTKDVKRKPKTASHVKLLKANAGPKVMQRILKENLRKAIIYDNKPRPEARGNSQTIASEGCKKNNKLVLQVYN